MYVQSWIDCLLAHHRPVPDHLVVSLSDLAVVRLNLDFLASTLLDFEKDWEEDHSSHFDHLTQRQRLIQKIRPPLFAHFQTTISTLQAICPHSGPGPVPLKFAQLNSLPGFHYPVLCVLCLSSLP